MIPTIPLSLMSGLLLGLLFAWAARSQFRDGRAPWGRELHAVASYQAVIRWPLLTYFFYAHREWSFMFLVDGSHLPGALLLLLLPLDAAALVGGYLGGWALQRRRGEMVLLGAAWASALALAILLVALRARLFQDGDAAAPGRSAGTPLLDGRISWTLLVVAAGSTAAAWAVYRTLVSESRRKAGPAEDEDGPAR